MNSVFQKYNRPCVNCGTIEDLTRHHVKNEHGEKTGRIKILCRKCHDKAEEEYARLGIISSSIKLTQNEQLQIDYMNGLIPFYSLGNTKEVTCCE